MQFSQSSADHSPHALVVWHGLCCAALIAVVTWALLCPDPYAALRSISFRRTVSVDDFVQHILAFVVLSVACLSFCRRLGIHAIVATIALLIYAAGTEMSQSLIPGRSTDVMDLIANLIGTALGAAGLWSVVLVLSPQDGARDRRHSRQQASTSV
jgi:VanZ family protein